MNRASLRRIWGLLYRHLALYRGSWPRLLELTYWPILNMCIWGFTASFLAARTGNALAVAGGMLLAAVLLWVKNNEPLLVMVALPADELP